jgi:hypothetical protein
MLILLAALIMLASVACQYGQGLWNAGVTFFNVVLATVIATNVYEPLADLLGPSLYMDFVAWWGTFCLLAFTMRLATDRVSRVRVRFLRPVDLAGSLVFGLATGWVMICFTVASLHVAPLARTALVGAMMPDPDARMLGVAPDRLWLALMHRQSQSALGRDDEHVFDPTGDFVLRHAARRAQTEPPPPPR